MQPETQPQLAQLQQHIQASLRRAEAYTAGLRKTHTTLVVGGLVSSAATTLVAGGAALGGAAAGLNTGGWQLTCGLAAILGFASTVCVGIVQQLRLGERLPQGQLCVGQLRALDVAMATGSRALGDIAKEYAAIVKDSSEVLG